MTSLYFNRTKDVFTEIYTYNPANNTTVTSQINLSKSYNYGINITNTSDVNKWWSVNTLFNVFENRLEGNIDGTNPIIPIVTFNLNTQNSFTISDNWKAEANAQYQSKSNEGVYKREQFFDFSIGISKQILANKGNIKLGVTDIFNTHKYNINAATEQTGINKRYNLDSRIATLAITYRI